MSSAAANDLLRKLAVELGRMSATELRELVKSVAASSREEVAELTRPYSGAKTEWYGPRRAW